jgi:hypothetical protein
MTADRNPTEARQAKPEGVVRYVLMLSLAGAIIALAIVFFIVA